MIGQARPQMGLCLPYHRYRYSNIGSNTTASMQKANHSLLHTVGHGFHKTGNVVKHGLTRTGRALKQSVVKTGRWVKKHKTGLAISALTTAGIGGVSGRVQAAADFDATQHDKEF